MWIQNRELRRLQVLKVVIENTDRGSVITWDFDVIKYDVMFCVFHTSVPVCPPCPVTLTGGSVPA